jgi:hypothetical protein
MFNLQTVENVKQHIVILPLPHSQKSMKTSGGSLAVASWFTSVVTWKCTGGWGQARKVKVQLCTEVTGREFTDEREGNVLVC